MRQYTPLFIVICILIFLVITKIHIETERQTITLHVPYADTTIYINGRKTASTKKPNDSITITPSIGTHTIIASRDNAWPWQKNIVVEKDSSHTYSVFTTPLSPKYGLVPEYTLDNKQGVQNNAYREIISLFETPHTNRTSKQETVSLKITDDYKNILATWLGETESIPFFFCIESSGCEKTFSVLPVEQEIRNVDFYPGRDDRIIVSVGKTIWIIELDRNEIQNAHPLYEGDMPNFAIDNDAIYIKDKESLMLIETHL